MGEMNRDRRNAIKKLIDQIGEIQSELDILIGEEQTSLDSIPESFETRRESIQDIIESLDGASNSLSECNDYLTEGIEK